MIYEEMKLDELNETLELIKRVFDEFEAPYYTKEGIENFYKFANYMTIKDMLKKNLKIIICKENYKIIGVIAYRDLSHISMLFVDKNYHRQGIATKLFNIMKDDCKIHNIALDKLTVNSSPYAVEFYHKIGFIDTQKEQEVDGIRFTPMNLPKTQIEEIKLVFPTEEYKEQMREYLQEHIDNNEFELAGDGGLDRIKDFDKWLEKIRNDVSKETIEDNRIPATLFLGVRKSDNKVIGTIQIRHYLNDNLLKNGGHIGDGVRPSERQKGYATEMIRLALKECRKLGIRRVLMVCYKDNIGSKKSIINNGGILENEIPAENGKIDQRYWISLKKRFASDIDTMQIVDETERKIININDDIFTGDIVLNVFKKMNKPYIIENTSICIANNNYKWLEFYDYNSKIRLTTMYDENNNIIEWYFDIARKIGKENNMPYEDDLYLDVVLKPDGDIILLDEDELKEAYERKEMTKEEYNEAYIVAKDLMKKIQGKQEEIKNFTDKYLYKML